MPEPGTRVRVWSCNNTGQQTWIVMRVRNSYILANQRATAAAGHLMVLDSSAGGLTLQPYDDSARDTQRWTGTLLWGCYNEIVRCD
jgi:hypothetical protein